MEIITLNIETMKKLINILCPKLKPISEWTNEDKRATLLFLLLALIFIIGGAIDRL